MKVVWLRMALRNLDKIATSLRVETSTRLSRWSSGHDQPRTASVPPEQQPRRPGRRTSTS